MIDLPEYYKAIERQLKNLVNERKNASTKDERALQEFFEQNPSSLLSALSGIDSQFSIFGNTIISQPDLKSFNGDRTPDFLIVTWNSLNLYFNFIEIEDPSKKIYSTPKQQPSPDFLQACNQLKQWSSLRTEVEIYCNHLLGSLFEGNFNNTSNKLRHYNFILLYGFSEEINHLGVRYNQILQEYFKEEHAHHCTYSRLLSNLRGDRPLFTVTKDVATNKFKAIGFTPFKKYKIDEWSDFHNITHKQNLISESELLTELEKDYLIKQITELDSKSVQEIWKEKSEFTITSFEDIDDIF